MKTFPLIISSPEGDLFRGDAVNLSLRGVEGDLAILAGHIPFITSVVPCDCSLELLNGEVKKGHTEGGVLTVSKDTVTLLSGTFVWQE